MTAAFGLLFVVARSLVFLTMSVGLKDDGKTLQACMKKHRSQMNAAIGTEKRRSGVAWIGS